MEMTGELFEFLARAARGDESECPPDVDAVWHACLANPEEYETFCLRHFGVLIEHVIDTPALCHASIR